MRSLHFTNAWHGSSGGIRTFYREMLATAVRRDRHMCLVVPDERTWTEDINPTVRIYHVAAPRSLFLDSRYRLLLPYAYLSPFHYTIRQILRIEKPELIEICDKYSLGWLAGLIRTGWIKDAGRPALVGLSHERMDDNVRAWISENDAFRLLSQKFMHQYYLPMFDYHIANSSYTAEELRNDESAHHHRLVFVRPMGVSLNIFSPGRRSPESRVSLERLASAGSGSKLLLYTGRISKEKNLQLLISTMKELSGCDGDYRLLVAGAGPQEEWFKKAAAREIPGKVFFLGQLTSVSELADVYANADAFVHPNPREPFGIAPLEAMASGLPVVAPRLGGVLTYANPGNAVLVEPTGPAFAEGIRTLFSNPRAKRLMALEARKTAESFSWDQVTEGFFELYDRLVEMARQETTEGRFNRKAKVGAFPGSYSSLQPPDTTR